VRELAPAFSFYGGHFGLTSPNNLKPHPLESATYEMLFCKSFLLIFMQFHAGHDRDFNLVARLSASTA
jgi:hypothetical protein